MKTGNILWMTAMAVLIAGCSGGSSTASSDSGGTPGKEKPKVLKIVMIAKSTTNPVFPVAQKGAEKAAAELSKSTGVNITIDWQTPPKEDGQVQAQKIEEGVNNGAGAILISCSDATKVTSAINDAVDKGVPVMTFDSDAPDSKRFAYYGTDDKDCGTEVMDQLGAILGGKGNIAILAGNPNAPNLQARVQAVKDEAAAKFPGIKIVTVANHDENAEAATAKVEEVMNAYPQINGWAMIGGWPLFATGLLSDLDPNKVKVVSVDALPAELAYIDKGIAPVLLAQPVYDWGYKSVQILVDHVINGKDVPVKTKMDLVKVDKTNIKQWAKQLQDWGLPGIDPKYLK